MNLAVREVQKPLDLPPLLENDVHEEEEHEGGAMEFFDWLAGTKDAELYTLAREHDIREFKSTDGIAYVVNPSVALSSRQREALGLLVWAAI